MNLINCLHCGRICVETPAKLCPKCMEQEEEAELLVIEFLRGNGRASVEEIKDATGVHEETILRMLKKGRFVGDFVVQYPCELCGALITEGRVCSSCNSSIMRQARAEAEKDAKKALDFKKAGRMYSTKYGDDGQK